MARSALDRCWLIEQDVLSLDLPKVLVASATANVLVSSFQRKRGFVVIEKRGSPLAGEVAFRAAGDSATSRKLQAVRFFVAVLALRRS